MLTVDQICEQLSRKIERGELDNSAIVQLIEHLGSYLNLQTIPDYAKSNGISYNGAKKFRHIKRLFNVSFVIDND